MAKAATVTREAGLSGLEFGLAIPGTVGGAVWANAGAHGSDMRAILVEALVVTADGGEAALRPDELGMGYRETRLKHAAPGRPEVVVAATFELQPAEPGTITARLDEIRRWRQAHQPLGQKSAGSVFRNPEGDSAGRIIDELGLKGAQVGGAMVSPQACQLHRQRRHGHGRRRPRPGRAGTATVRRERGIDLRYEVEFVGDWPTGRAHERERDEPAERARGAAGPAMAPRLPHRHRRALGRPVRGARRLARLRTLHRHRPARARPRRERLAHRPRRRAGGRCPRRRSTRPCRRPPTTTPRRWAHAARSRRRAALEELAASRPRPVVFPAIHGPFGEDGQVQALLESVGLIYCGAGPAASAVGMDKTLFKRVCGSLELPVLPWVEVRAGEYAADPTGVEAAMLDFSRGFPDPRLICKPARLGSSIGITIVHRPDDRAELGAALQDALRYDDLVLLEPYLDHPRELETSVLGNRGRTSWPTARARSCRAASSTTTSPSTARARARTMAQADLDPDLAADIRAAAAEVYLAIGASGFARVDMLLSADGIPFISEINTIPGFTPISLFPRLTAQGGYDFGGTCERIVELALEHAAGRPARHLRAADLP